MRKNKSLSLSVVVGAVLILVVPLLSAATAPTRMQKSPPNTPPAARLEQAYGKLPLTFEANRGQTDSQVKFLSRGRGSTLFLTSTEAVLVLTKAEGQAKGDRLRLRKPDLTRSEKVTQTVVRMKFVGGNPQPPVAGLEELPGRVNYFTGNDPTKWRTNVPTYGRVEYQDLYPGVNLVYYGNQRQLEYDFVVAPGANPEVIRLAFEGVDRLALDSQGNLVLYTAGGEVVQRAPVVYQEINGARRQIVGRYVVQGRNRVGFEVAAYDRTKPMVIDPVLVYSTYLGGTSRDDGVGVAVDASGNAYVVGFTRSLDFPTVNAFQPGSGGGVNEFDAFVAKLNAAGTALVYSTYLGGSVSEGGFAIAVDASGNAYVTGCTTSANFPTVNPLQPAFAGIGPSFLGDAFVTKLDATGSVLVYSTYLGGSGDECGTGIRADASGNAYVVGNTTSTNFPTVNALQTAFGGGPFDAFVAELNATGSALVYSTYLGGSGDDEGFGIAVDGSGNAYVTGQTSSLDFPTLNALQPAYGGGPFDGFVTKLNATGALVYSTYLGAGREDFGGGIAVDASGSAYVAGGTNSPDFPTVNALQPGLGGGFDVFVAKLNSAGSALVYSTYLGGSGDDEGFGIAIDGSGNAYVTGPTTSPNFPTASPLQPAFGGSSGGFFGDAFVAKLNPTGSALVYSTYLGGSGDEGGVGIAVDAAGSVYVTGETDSPNFPTVNPLQPAFAGGTFDAFVAKISEINTPAGTNIAVQPTDLTTGTTPVTLTFSTVSQAGVTSLSTGISGPTPPSGVLLGSPPTSYDLTTTAVFSGSVTVCINYTGVSFADETQLKLFHLEAGVLVDRTTSLDTTNNIICASVTSLSPFAILEPGRSVTIDIKPGSFPNTINLGSGGTVPVAIFSTPTFDATTVNPTSVTLASAPVKLKGKGTPLASFQDVNGDGLVDLVVHVDTTALQLSATDTLAVLQGKTFGGEAIGGTDLVRVVP